MKTRFVKCSILLSALSAAVFARADVWTDCAAWYSGGKGVVGAFATGDMTDLRHAAIADSPTHGGTARTTNAGASNLIETVYSAASGRTFQNQRTIYLPQRDGTFSGTYKVYENGITLPFAATNENYTLLMRARLDEVQPTNKPWVYVADLGYQGGSTAANRYAFGFRYNSTTEQIGVLYNNGSNSKSIAPTNDVCTTLRGTWVEFSVTLEKLSSGKSRMRFGVGAEGLSRTYGSQDYTFPEGQNLPAAGKVYLGGVTGYGGASTSCSAARGSYQMVSYWERVLTDAEILEAFKLQGPDGSAAQSPALLKVGDPAWSADVLGGTIAGTEATVSTDLQDIGKFPARIAAGQTLSIPFSVPSSCTNLRQVVRLGVSDDMASTKVRVSIDDAFTKTLTVAAGRVASLGVDASVFTEGEHLLKIACPDAGTGPLKLTTVEISGSWRLGWIDGSTTPFASDTASSVSVSTNMVGSLSSADWSTLRGTIKSSRILALKTELDESDAARRNIVLRAKPFSAPGQTFDFVLLANDKEVYRRTISPNAPYASGRFNLIEVPFSPGTLQTGANVFTFKTEVNAELDPSPTSTWLKFDYFEMEMGEAPSSTFLLIR